MLINVSIGRRVDLRKLASANDRLQEHQPHGLDLGLHPYLVQGSLLPNDGDEPAQVLIEPLTPTVHHERRELETDRLRQNLSGLRKIGAVIRSVAPRTIKVTASHGVEPAAFRQALQAKKVGDR